LATVKYVLTFPYALLIGLNFQQTLISVTLGGILGFYFFYHFSGFAIRQFHHVKTFVWKHSPHSIRNRYRQIVAWRKSITGEKVFTKRSRFIVKFRSKYGLIGIVIASPIILSLPIGAYLLNKYYPRHKLVMPYMILSILSWAVVFFAFGIIFPNLVR
jgi:hypothetical protein